VSQWDVLLSQPAAGAGAPLHVYVSSTDQWSAEELLELERQLSPKELQRAQSYYFPRDRATYTLARVMLRNVLAEHVNCPPQELRFLTGTWGKPELSPPVSPQQANVSFSLSHSGTLAACALGAHSALGIDIEMARATVPKGVAERCLGPRELRYWGSLDQRVRPEVLLRLWTLKEAFAKARGVGLRLPFAQVEFLLSNHGIEFAPHPSLDDGQTWGFVSLCLLGRSDGNQDTARHPLAVAARGQAGVQLHVRQWRAALRAG
jgi:4'-phosphopantetheinyl transferase